MVLPIIFGLKGTKLSLEEADLFSSYPVTGFILFSRNIESASELIELTTSLKALYPSRKVPIFIDQEGGRVARVKPPIASQYFPAAKHFADIYEKDPKLAKLELEANYIKLMSDLIKLGIDSPCAPVCDLFFEDAHDVIGNRSFGSNPNKVIDLCKSAISGIKQAGGYAFIKHIPGHGRANVDSHFDLPIINTSLEEFEVTDFKVFKELAEEVEYAMTAHIIYSALDETQPATISDKVIDYIRNNIGFKGQLMTDDINMYALHGEVGKKHSILKKVIKLSQGDLEWKNEYAQSLMDLFNINIHQFTDLEIIEICKKRLNESNIEFLPSLVRIARMSLVAGCDLVLHCSGDLDEMQAICESKIQVF